MKLRRRHFTRQIAAAATAGAVWGVRPRGARAAGTVTATATLDTTTTVVGSGVTLELSVRSTGGAGRARPVLPAAIEDNFEVVRSISGGTIGTGGSEFTHEVTIVPLKAGEFELGFAINVGGELVESNVPVLKVTGEPAATEAPEAAVAGALPTEPRGDIFLWATTDKATAYVGEQITYSLDVYERRQYLNVHLRKPPTFSDFFSEELPQGESEIRPVGEVPYRVEPGIRRALFAQRAGTLTIGQAEISVGLRKRLKSSVLSVEVLPLPAEGQPAGFSPNNVGSYTLEASVDRTTVDAGEPFTLTLTIQGAGNIKFIDPGVWPEVSGLRRYEPKVDTRVRTGSSVGGLRRYEFLMIPEAAGTIAIPEHSFWYFDPDQGQYAEAKSAALQVEVRGADGAVAAGDDGTAYDAPAEDEARLAEVIGGTALPDDAPRSRWLTTTRWVYGMLAVPALAAVGLGGAALVRRFGPDDKARARARDKMRRQIRIKAAEDAVEAGEGFHTTLSKLLHELAVRRAGPDGVGLPRPELLRLLQAREASEADLDELRTLLDDCDAARFGAQTGSADDRRALLDRALELVRSSSLSKEGA